MHRLSVMKCLRRATVLCCILTSLIGFGLMHKVNNLYIANQESQANEDESQVLKYDRQHRNSSLTTSKPHTWPGRQRNRLNSGRELEIVPGIFQNHQSSGFKSFSRLAGRNKRFENHSKFCPEPCSCVYSKDREITKLDCSDKNLSLIPPLPTTVQQVYLNDNKISSIPCMSFQNLAHLHELDLSHNKIQHLLGCVFRGLKSLRSLHVAHNNITKLPLSIFDSLNSLQDLDLSKNIIATIDRNSFNNLANLRRLILSLNHLKVIQNGTFLGLKSLTFLSLSQNKLRYLPRTFEMLAFDGLTSLETLHLHGNQPDFPDEFIYPDEALSRLPWLKHLTLDGHPKPLGSGFASLINLSSLSFGRWDLETVCYMGQSLPATFFEHFNSSQPLTLSLSVCKIAYIPAEFFKYIPNIYAIDLSFNNFGFDGFENGSVGLQSSNLTYLNLTSIINDTTISYTTINRTNFRHLEKTKTRSLQLDINRIAYIESNATMYLPLTLEFLSIYGNDVFIVYVNVLHLKQLRAILASEWYIYDIYKSGWRDMNKSIQKNNSLTAKLSKYKISRTILHIGHFPYVYGDFFRYSTIFQNKSHSSSDVPTQRDKTTIKAGVCGNEEWTYIPLPENVEELYLSKDDLRCRAFMDQVFLPRLRQMGLSLVLGAIDFPAGPVAASIAGAVANTEKTLVVLSKDIFQDYHRELEVSLSIMDELYVRRPVLVPVLLLNHQIQPLQEQGILDQNVDELVDELLDHYPRDITVFLQGQAHRCLIYDGGSEPFWQSLEDALCEDL